jgi:Calcineurin-like phosphoesterase
VWSGLRSRAKERPRLPEGVRIYAIGDIHGRLDLLGQLMSRIDANLSKNPVGRAIEVYLGDYIDRGPASRQVIDRLIERSHKRNTVFLKGNHETYVPEFIANPSILNDWRQYGGLETLMSYGLQPQINADPAEQIALAKALAFMLPRSHQEFFTRLPLCLICGDFFFVHAGVKPRVPFKHQREKDLLWIREDFLLFEHEFERVVVHGHTPVHEPDIRPNRINIDTGAYATGRLTCLVLERDHIDVL